MIGRSEDRKAKPETPLSRSAMRFATLRFSLCLNLKCCNMLCQWQTSRDPTRLISLAQEAMFPTFSIPIRYMIVCIKISKWISTGTTSRTVLLSPALLTRIRGTSRLIIAIFQEQMCCSAATPKESCACFRSTLKATRHYLKHCGR